MCLKSIGSEGINTSYSKWVPWRTRMNTRVSLKEEHFFEFMQSRLVNSSNLAYFIEE
jgi:hypothetical protein